MSPSPNPHAWLLADLDKVPKNGLRVFSTFSCGGGSCMGYKLAGYEITGANDCDEEMAEHYQRNLKVPHYFLCSISELVEKDDLGEYKRELPAELYDIDVLDGSPPCSTFSTAGSREKDWGKNKKFREGQKEQVLSDLFFEYLKMVERLRPKVSIAENVTGMLQGNAKGYVKAIFAEYRRLGYRPQLFEVNAADCGVPQARKRVFFIALRNDLAESLPPLVLDFCCRHVSAREACEDVQELTREEIEDTAPLPADLKWWAVTRPGEKYAASVKRASLSNSLWNWIRHPADRPACTLMAAHQCMKHWAVCRSLSLREYIRLGSFPDDYQVRTMDRGKYLIGMSVPPKMAAAVGRAVADQWLLKLPKRKGKRPAP